MRGDRSVARSGKSSSAKAAPKWAAFSSRLHQKVESHTHRNSDAVSIIKAPSSIELSATFPDICKPVRPFTRARHPTNLSRSRLKIADSNKPARFFQECHVAQIPHRLTLPSRGSCHSVFPEQLRSDSRFRLRSATPGSSRRSHPLERECNWSTARGGFQRNRTL